MDTYERKLEQMRQALANAWEAGFVAAVEEETGFSDPSVVNRSMNNPYVKEN